MRKLALALMAASAAVFGLGVVASADGYDPALVVEPSSPGSGAPYTVTYLNCVVGETITFAQAESTPTTLDGLCEPIEAIALSSVVGLLLPQQQQLGSASVDFDAAPIPAGTYNGTASGPISPQLPFSFTITADEEEGTTTTTLEEGTTTTTLGGQPTLPETGSNGTRTMTGIAISLLVVGLGMFVVAQARRRQSLA